ncbi:MAG: Uma2 family endonuclease [Abditibacteriales bacterium]|nr:Uma2 family endonuclease [Abditibacteriales bacterium]
MVHSVTTDARAREKPPRTRRDGYLPLTTRLAFLFPRQGEWTEEDYFALPETNRIVELSNGRLVIPDLPTDSHQFAVGRLFIALSLFVQQHHLGHVRVAPLRVRLWEGKIREPDVVFLKREHENRKGEEYWGVPDLVVEVISPRTEHSSGTEKTDRKDKFKEYEQAGVSEYWLVDPQSRTIEVYVLRGGKYVLLGKWGMGEVARSEMLPNFAVPVEDVVGRE